MVAAIIRKEGRYRIVNASMPGEIGTRLFIYSKMPDLPKEADTLDELPIKEWVDALADEAELKEKRLTKKRRRR